MESKYPQSYIDYLVHFHGERDYFECHEVLEEYWKDHTSMERNSIWVAWIQLAVALYHHRRNNFSGAKRTINKAISKFRMHEESIHKFGVDPKLFLEQIQSLELAISAKTPYTSITLPINDSSLKKTCYDLCNKRGFQWGSESDLNNPDIVDRHRLRDRQEIILLRQSELNKRKNENH